MSSTGSQFSYWRLKWGVMALVVFGVADPMCWDMANRG
jgi:hypothetical protein